LDQEGRRCHNWIEGVMVREVYIFFFGSTQGGSRMQQQSAGNKGPGERPRADLLWQGPDWSPAITRKSDCFTWSDRPARKPPFHCNNAKQLSLPDQEAVRQFIQKFGWPCHHMADSIKTDLCTIGASKSALLSNGPNNSSPLRPLRMSNRW